MLKNIRTDLIDPDTPDSERTKKDFHGNTWHLAFSDEFNTPGRSFYEGDDPYWTAVDIWYGVTRDLEWYDPDAVTTNDGVLELRFDAFQNHGLELQIWHVAKLESNVLQRRSSRSQHFTTGSRRHCRFLAGFLVNGQPGQTRLRCND